MLLLWCFNGFNIWTRFSNVAWLRNIENKMNVPPHHLRVLRQLLWNCALPCSSPKLVANLLSSLCNRLEMCAAQDFETPLPSFYIHLPSIYYYGLIIWNDMNLRVPEVWCMVWSHPHPPLRSKTPPCCQSKCPSEVAMIINAHSICRMWPPSWSSQQQWWISTFHNQLNPVVRTAKWFFAQPTSDEWCSLIQERNSVACTVVVLNAAFCFAFANPHSSHA